MARRNCKEEVLRYRSRNYTKTNTIQHLLCDGYSRAEIDAALQQVDFRESEQDYYTMVTQFPTLLYFGMMAVASVVMGWGEHGTTFSRTLSSSVSVALVVLLALYFIRKRAAILVFTILSVLAFFGFGYRSFITFSEEDLWFREDYDIYFWNIVAVLVPVWLFYLNVGLLKKLK